MNVRLVEKNSDHDGPVLNITCNVDDPEGYFDLGVLFEQLTHRGACVWRGAGMIRIPLVKMDEIGLAITSKKDESK
jgi:hypothetical protein